MGEINNEKEGNILDLISAYILDNKFDAIHLSIDIDALDPQYAPGTGVPVTEGLNPTIFLQIIENIKKFKSVLSFDIVEFNPLLDEKGITEIICKKVCDIIIKD